MNKRKFVKKPIVIEAFQFGYDENPDWFHPKNIVIEYQENKSRLKGCIETLEGNMWFWEGDYVIKGVKNEQYPCRRDIFEETYYEIDQ